ncbi:Pre-mRNA-splicing factor 38A [Bulinus truncatus]|nr:Pre-mRNA-splicing factor 38A [Bulinus truncatus]
MANRTVKDAHSIKGTNPQYLVEKIIRTRIYECRYWKEECFALTAALMVDKAMELKYVGGVYGGNIKPVPFLCLLLKMLQIQPEKDIVVEFIKNEDFKYVRALGALYMRLTGTSTDCYKYLEPLYYDYRKLKRIDRNGAFHIIHMDEFIDELLREERICDIILPRIQKRNVLEETNILEPRVSAIEEDIDDVESEEEEELPKDIKKIVAPPPVKENKPPRQSSPHRRRLSPRRRDSHRHRSPVKRRSRSRERADKRHRSPEIKHKDDVRHKRGSKKVRHEPEEDRHRKRPAEKDRPHRDKARDHKSHRDDKRDGARDDRRDGGRDDRREGVRGDRREDRRDGVRDNRRDERRDGGRDDRRDRDDKGRKNMSSAEQEMKEANELRAKLGLAPLRP